MDNNPAILSGVFPQLVKFAIHIDNIPTKHRSQSRTVAARSRGGDLGLELLEAHSEIGVTFILGAVLVVGALQVVAAFPAQQFSIDILQ